MPINNPTPIVEYYDPASRRIKESIESGISVPVLVIGDSSTTAATYWAAAAMKKLGEQLGCNVKHRAYVHAATDYEGWSYLNTAGADRHFHIAPSSEPRLLPNAAVTVTSADLDFAIKFAMDDWDSGAAKYLIVKWGAAGNRTWSLFLGANSTFYLMWSANGTDTAYTANFNSVSLAALTNAVPVWYRFTLDVDDGAGHYVATLYSSPDGYTWTSAQAVTGGATTALFVSTADYGIGSSVSATTSSTGNTSGDFYEVVMRDGILGKVINPQPIENWNAANEDGDIRGTPTIYVWNGSVAGEAVTTATARTKTTPKLYQPVVIVSLSYNDERRGGETYQTLYEALLAMIEANMIRPYFVLTSQAPTEDPALYIDGHKKRAYDIMGYAGYKHYGHLNMYRLFEESGADLTTLLNVDGLHPNAAGQAMMTDCAYRYFMGLPSR